MNEQKAVLFIPLGTYSFDQQLATALYLASQSNLTPHFLLISEKDHRFIDRLDAAGIPYSTLDPVRAGGEVSDGALSNSGQEWLKYRVQSPFKWFRWWQQLWLGKRSAKGLARLLAPRCAVASQERLHLFLPVLKALRELGVPIILMPAAESLPDGSAALRQDSYMLKAGLGNPSAKSDNHLRSMGVAILNRMVQRLLPSQVYDSPWGKMLFYPAGQIFLLKLMGILPRNPWYQGTTFADYIMISGIDEAAMHDEARVAPGKLLFYGSHELDVLFESRLRRKELRHEFIETYQLDPNKSVLMVSLPRWREQGIGSADSHWNSINKILDVLSHKDCNVVISLHPSSDRNHYDWIEEKYPVRICGEPLKDVLVIADVFVASYSSTIRWAIGLGIPVINLDLWQYNFNKQYRNLTGYQTVNTISEFDELVRILTAAAIKQGFSSELSPVNPLAGHSISETAGSGQVWSGVLFDGKAKERLLHFIQSLDGATAYAKAIPKQPEAVR